MGGHEGWGEAGTGEEKKTKNIAPKYAYSLSVCRGGEVRRG